jgi:hypothetical protein
MTTAPQQTPAQYAADLVADQPGITTLDLFSRLREAYPSLAHEESADVALSATDTTRPSPEA